MNAADLTVVIPTRNRADILARTVDALAGQNVSGFDVVVVVDGTDQPVPDVPGARVIRQPHGGPGTARNRGVAATDRPLVLFLGDDMIPTRILVERHLDGHRRYPAPHVGVLGRVDWHPDVAGDRLAHWLDRSASQFDFAGIDGDDAGWFRFYSCNVSLKREFFTATGGFDEGFRFDYEDLDLGYRLHEHGFELRYEPAALAHHLHRYDWARLVARYRSRGDAEWRMARKHEWFQPFFGGRVRAALERPEVARVWPLVAERVDRAPAALRDRVRRRADRWYHQQLADAFADGWEGARGLDELKEYLGADFEERKLFGHVHEVEREEAELADEGTFYRTSRMYLYDLTAFAMTGTKTPYLRALRRCVRPPARLLDYGCGIGSDGLRLMEMGYRVEFADFDNPSTSFLRWRLARRGLTAPVHDVDRDVPTGFDAAYAFDVIEHVPDPFAFLGELEARADLVAVNFLEPDPADTHLHRPLPIRDLVRHAGRHGLLHYRRYHGRSHLVIYRTRAGTARRVTGAALVGVEQARTAGAAARRRVLRRQP